MNSVQAFSKGQYVYAKVKDCTPWPAKIMNVVSKNRFAVCFYGSDENSLCHSSVLSAYNDENRVRFNTETQMAKPQYREAVEQIEKALRESSPCWSSPAIDNQSRLRQTTVQVEPVAEHLSRSGRKINKKKIGADEVDPDELFGPQAKRFNLQECFPSTPKPHVFFVDPVQHQQNETSSAVAQFAPNIKIALGMDGADVDRSIQLLVKFKKEVLPRITKNVLFLNPDIVYIIKKLSKYVGNTSKWNFDQAQIENFKEKSAIIREIAFGIYSDFKLLFTEEFDQSQTFLTFFTQEVAKQSSLMNVE